MTTEQRTAIASARGQRLLHKAQRIAKTYLGVFNERGQIMPSVMGQLRNRISLDVLNGYDDIACLTRIIGYLNRNFGLGRELAETDENLVFEQALADLGRQVRDLLRLPAPGR